MLQEDAMPRRKHIRLDPSLYSETGHVCSNTVSTLDRKPIFWNAAFARVCVDLLASLAEDSGVQVYAYCFMPDHLHMLIRPSEKKSIIDFVREFKGLSTRLAWQHDFHGKIWQSSFYDHFLRRDEDLELAGSYILNNPMRKEMVEEWQKYPYSGSLVF